MASKTEEALRPKARPKTLREKLLSSLQRASSEEEQEFFKTHPYYGEVMGNTVFINEKRLQEEGSSGNFIEDMLFGESLHKLKEVSPEDYLRLKDAADKDPEVQQWKKDSYQHHITEDPEYKTDIDTWWNESRLDQVIGGYILGGPEASLHTVRKWNKEDLPFGTVFRKELENFKSKLDVQGFAEGGLAQQTEEALGWAAEGKKLAVDIPEVSFKDAATFVAEMTPIVGDAMAAKEVYDELQKDEPNYYLAGALGGAALIGLIPGVGDVAAKAIKKGAKEVFDVAKRVEVDPNAMGSGLGNVKLKPKDSVIKANPPALEEEMISVFPKPQRMFPEGQQPPGGDYLDPKTGTVLSGRNVSKAKLQISPEGKPSFKVSNDDVESVGSTGKGKTQIKTNLFKKKAGWKWTNSPEGMDGVETLISVQNRGKHYYTLETDFSNGVNLKKYPDAPSEPRLRPTVTGEIEIGEPIGLISVRGKEHPVYKSIRTFNKGGMPMGQQTEEALGVTKQVGIGSVSSARQKGAMGSILPSDATNALDVLAEERRQSGNTLKLDDTLKKDVESALQEEPLPAIEYGTEVDQSKDTYTSLRPKSRPKPVRLSPIDKVLKLNYLLKGGKDPLSKTTKILSGLDIENEDQQATIKGFFDSAVGGDTGYDPTVTAWCAAFVSHILEELGADPLKAKDKYDRIRADKFKNYGTQVNREDLKEGDIIVFDFDQDGKGDHVTFYAGNRITSQGTDNYVNVLGGNQSGQVSIRENNPNYTWDTVAAIRRITYDDIDFDFTKEMAEQDPVFNKFIPKYAETSQPLSGATSTGNTQFFNKGGMPMGKQTEMAFMQKGGIKDDGMKKDPVSGNPIPAGSMAKEVRDDIPAMLSEGEYVVPADVLRFYGVNYFEDLRNKAKSGLQNMEDNGRIGGEPVSPQQAQQNMGKAPMQANQGGTVGGFDNGGLQAPGTSTFSAPNNYLTPGGSLFPQSNTSFGGNSGSIVTFKTFVHATTGDQKVIQYMDGKLSNPSDSQYTGAPYYELGSAALKNAQNAPKEGGGGNDDPPPTTPTPTPTPFGEDVDWSDPDAYADSIMEKGFGIGRTAGSLSAVLGPVGMIGAGIANIASELEAITSLQAARILAQAQGLDTAAIDAHIKTALGQSTNLSVILNKIGNGGMSKAMQAAEKAGMSLGTEKDENGDLIFTPEQIASNLKRTKFKKDKPKIIEKFVATKSQDVQDYGKEAKKIKEDDPSKGFAKVVAEMVNAGNVGNPENVVSAIDYETPSVNSNMTMAEQYASYGAGSAGNKGGLMTRKKTKKKKK